MVGNSDSLSLMSLFLSLSLHISLSLSPPPSLSLSLSLSLALSLSLSLSSVLRYLIPIPFLEAVVGARGYRRLWVLLGARRAVDLQPLVPVAMLLRYRLLYHCSSLSLPLSLSLSLFLSLSCSLFLSLFFSLFPS